MAYYSTLHAFYKSKEWLDFKTMLILERTADDGLVYCEHCGKPMVSRGDIIPHHFRTFLTIDNVNDANISLNPDNIQLVHFKCHNEIHDRFGAWTRHIYLVYGCPLSGKSSFVQERAGFHDLIIDMDKIYACISNNPMFIKSGRIADNAFSVRDCLLQDIKMRRGKWVNAFIVGGYPLKAERERLCTEYGAEEIFIECDMETALSRLDGVQDGRDKTEWKKYIDTWFSRHS